MAELTEQRRLRLVPTLLFSLLALACLTLAMPDGGAAAASPYPMLEAAASVSGLFLLAPAAAILAFLYRFSPRIVWAALIPLSVLLTFLRLQDIFTAAMAALVFPSAFALHLFLQRGVPRTSAVCMLSGLFFVLLAGIGFITFSEAAPELSPSAWLSEAGDEFTALLRTLQAEEEGKIYAYFSTEQAASVTELFLSLLPGMCILFCNLTAWLSHTCALLLYRLHRLGRLLSPQTVTMTASTPAALLFAASCFVSVLTSLNEDWLVVTAVSDNLILIFEPLLAYIGGLTLAAFWRKRGASRSTLILLTLSGLLLCEPSLFLLLLAFIGVFRTLRKPKAER